VMCSPFWKLHQWRPWTAARRVIVYTQYVSGLTGETVGAPMETGQRVYQQRECGRCGRIQTRAVNA